MKNLLLIACAFGFAACTNNSGSKKDAPAAVAKPAGPNATPVAPEILRESYEFTENGCYTRKHEFVSIDSDDLKKQLCTALQDDQLNGSNGCAENLRRELFEKKCAGLTWTVQYHSGAKTANPRTENMAQDQKVGKSLEFVLVDRIAISEAITGDDKLEARQLGQDLLSCGLSYLGPKCLGQQSTSAFHAMLHGGPESFDFYSQIKTTSMSSFIAIVFDVKQIEPSVQATEFKIFKILKPRGTRSMKSYLQDEKSVQVLLKGWIAQDFQAGLLSRLNAPRDIRELYHLTRKLLEISKEDRSATLATIQESIQKNARHIVDSADTKYQEEFLALMINELKMDGKVLTTICESFLNSTSANLQQVAAVEILTIDPKRDDMKNRVLRALNGSNSELRRKATLALSKSNMTVVDGSEVLQRLNDPDIAVQKEATEIAQNMPVSDRHLPALRVILVTSRPSARLQAIKVLGRINTDAANLELIQFMNDTDPEVVKEVWHILNHKSLDAACVDALTQKMASSSVLVRKQAAKLLGKIDIDLSIMALIGRLGDSDSDVEKTITAQLMNNSLNNSHVEALAVHYSNQQPQVRVDVSQLLGKIMGFEADGALIKQLSDSDREVRQVTMKQLSQRKLTEDSLRNLVPLLQNSEWTVRKDAATLLGKIKCEASAKALNEQLSFEREVGVIQAIVTSREAIK